MALGDVVLSVDGESMQGQSISTLKQRIVGAVGSFVSISFDSVWYSHPSSFIHMCCALTSYISLQACEKSRGINEPQ